MNTMTLMNLLNTEFHQDQRYMKVSQITGNLKVQKILNAAVDLPTEINHMICHFAKVKPLPMKLVPDKVQFIKNNRTSQQFIKLYDDNTTEVVIKEIQVFTPHWMDEMKMIGLLYVIEPKLSTKYDGPIVRNSKFEEVKPDEVQMKKYEIPKSILIDLKDNEHIQFHHWPETKGIGEPTWPVTHPELHSLYKNAVHRPFKYHYSLGLEDVVCRFNKKTREFEIVDRSSPEPM